MTISRRYTPEHAPGDGCQYGMDFSFVLPPGVGIDSGSCNIFTNTVEPQDATADWTFGDVTIMGRAIYQFLSGGLDGTDYQLRWSITDTEGNTFRRTALVLCSETS